MTDAIGTIALPGGETVPALGLGTWRMGEDPARRADEIAALRASIDLGMTLIDTAEMYGDGGAEELLAEALQGRRDEVFLVSKLLPENGGRDAAIAACERSLARLRTDRIDLYLLHWRGTVPLAETLAAFDALQRAGKIRHWGVSNFDLDDMTDLEGRRTLAPVATNQVLYNLMRRGIEFDLLPWCRERGLPVMAYSPLEQGRLLRNPGLNHAARAHGVSPAQLAIGWLLAQDGVIVIPKATSLAHVREIRAATALRFSRQQQAVLDRSFPPPTRRKPLAML